MRAKYIPAEVYFSFVTSASLGSAASLAKKKKKSNQNKLEKISKPGSSTEMTSMYRTSGKIIKLYLYVSSK